MGRKLSAGPGVEDKPSVFLTGNIGDSFTGRMLGFKKEIKTKLGGVKFLYELAAVDGNAPISKKSGDGYVDVDVSAGDPVTLFASSLLHKMLQQVQVGETVKITFLGKVKSKKGFAYNNFEAEVTDDPAVPFN